MSAHTPGPWSFRETALDDADLAAAKQHGLRIVPMQDNNGARFVMGLSGRVALVDCQTQFKRGQGHMAECAERDANARLIAAAPTMYDYIAARADDGDQVARSILESVHASS